MVIHLNAICIDDQVREVILTDDFAGQFLSIFTCIVACQRPVEDKAGLTGIGHQFDVAQWRRHDGVHLKVRVFAVGQSTGQGAVDVTGNENDILQPVRTNGLQQPQPLPGKTGPGVIPVLPGIGEEHHAGDHQFDPRRAADQPLAQGIFLFGIKQAAIIGG
ncbi:hypothetical protein D3C84_588560 [compost metagenome]